MLIERSPTLVKRTRSAQRLILSGVAIVAIQGILMARFTRPIYLPSPPPLSSFVIDADNWRQIRESSVDPVTYEMLAPDDYLSRDYLDPSNKRTVSLFIAYYKTQNRAKNAHDPKVCLPGSGFNPIESKTVRIQTASGEITANHYLVAKGLAKNVVVYWHQTHNQTFTGDQSLHFSRLFHSLRDNRTDMALVRIVAPVQSEDVAAASGEANKFVRSAYGSILKQFPAKI